MSIEILERSDYHGCELRKERLTGEDAGLHKDESLDWEMVYAPDGGLVGTLKEAHALIVVKGIIPQRRKPEHAGCTVGFSERKQKWYGWSHRAGFGFGIGSRYFSGWDNSSERMIHTLEEACESAHRFAEAVN